MVHKVKGVVGRHPVLAGMGMLIVVSAVVGGIVWNSMFGLEPTVVYFGVPDAPTLTATNNETIYRLDASRSTITYNVTEKLAGTTHTATGTTRGIAGNGGRLAADGRLRPGPRARHARDAGGRLGGRCTDQHPDRR